MRFCPGCKLVLLEEECPRCHIPTDNIIMTEEVQEDVQSDSES